MAMSADREPEERAGEETPEREWPGRRLRAAREARGLSIQEVARRLNLRCELVEALEEAQEEKLPPTTFVAGYVRSYARLMDLASEPLVSELFREPPSLVSPVGQPAQVRSSDLSVRLITYLIIALLLGGIAAAWWFSGQEGDMFTPSEEAVVTAPETATEPKTAPEPTPPALTREPEAGGWERLAEPEPVPDPESAPPVTERPTAPQEGEGMAPVETAPVVEPEPSVVEAPEVETAPESERVPAAAAQARLRIVFSEPCWVELEDASGERLAYRTFQEGEELVVTGQAPFQVFLGYAAGAELFLNGEPFDHTPFRRGNIARFRLGSADDNRSPAE